MDYHFQKRKQILSISGSNRCYTWRLCVLEKRSVTCHILFFFHTHTYAAALLFLLWLVFSTFCINLHKDTSQVRICFPSALNNFISTCTHTFYAVCMLLYNIYFTRIYLIMFLCCIYCQMQCHFEQFLWFWQVPNSASVTVVSGNTLFHFFSRIM